MSRQHASVSQGPLCSDNCSCCRTEIENAVQTFCLTHSQYTDAKPTSPSADSITPGAGQGNDRTTNCSVTGMTRPRERSTSKAGIDPRSVGLEADALTTRPIRRPQAHSLPHSCTHCNRLVGLVVKASASRAEGPGFESRLRWDFFRGRVILVT